jgi:hypothetical protein
MMNEDNERKINIDWVKSQFAESKIRVNVGKAVLNLLDTWESIPLEGEPARKALEVFSTLALGHALVNVSKDELWIDAGPGQLKVGDYVRVHHDAFDGSTGEIHNGRRGVIIAIRSGDIIINSIDDKNPKLEGSHYSPFKLQKRVK